MKGKDDLSGREKKKASVESAPKWTLWIFILAISSLIVIHNFSFSKKESGPVSSRLENPSNTPEFLKDTLRLHLGDFVSIALDTSYRGVVIFPKEGYKEFEVVGGEYWGWAFKDWKNPKIGRPNMDPRRDLWLDKNGLFPLFWKFKAIDGIVILRMRVRKS